MTESVEKNERQLSVKELERLIFLSFMHSQGSPEVQESFIIGMKDYYGEQSEERVQEAFSAFFKAQYDTLDGINLANKNLHTHIHPELFEKENESVNPFFETSNAKYGSDDYFMRLFDGLHSRDANYINSTEGRPNRKDNQVLDNFAHRYFSFLKTYLLESKPTGDPALDKTYKDLSSWLQGRHDLMKSVHELVEQQSISSKKYDESRF